jgi:hypothetical protein
LDNYTAKDNEPMCLIPSPGGSLLCVRPLGHEPGCIWVDPTIGQVDD